MTQDERLIPAGRDLDRSLTELAQPKPYGRYDRYSGAQTETNLREYFFVILKRKWLILSLVLVVTSLVTIQAYRQPSIYEAATTIRIEAKPQSPLQTGQIVINTAPDPSFWNTQLKLLENPSLARQVIVTLNLQKDPAFLGGQAQSGIFDSLKRIFSHERPVTPAKTEASDTQPVGEEQMKDRQFTPEELTALEPYEDSITGNLTVEPVLGTSLVNIRYRHTDPALAQKIANTLADVFITNNLERQESGTSKADVLLMQEIAKYQDKLKKESDARFAFARDNDLPLGPDTGNNIEIQRSQTYSAQLLAAENDRRNLTAIYEAAKNAPDLFSNPEVQKDPSITKLRQALSDLKNTRTALLQKYTEEWPEVKQIEAQIKDREDELAKAPLQVLASMKAAADAANQEHCSTGSDDSGLDDRSAIPEHTDAKAARAKCDQRHGWHQCIGFQLRPAAARTRGTCTHPKHSDRIHSCASHGHRSGVPAGLPRRYHQIRRRRGPLHSSPGPRLDSRGDEREAAPARWPESSNA
jgi:uncharacterized protein involved in exopolysaccharide biosynthesis